MKRAVILLLSLVVFFACASNVEFYQSDPDYVITEKSSRAEIVFNDGLIKKPHKVIGIIEAHLGKDSKRAELNELMIEKAREIGADGIMQVEYDVDRDTYYTNHHKVVGRGPHRHHVVDRRKHVTVDKSATSIAVIFVEE